MVENALESAAKEPSIKRFVYCSSSSAATQHKVNEKFDLTFDSWNEEDVARAWAPPPYTMDRLLPSYNASKVQGEQAFWKFVKERKPGFVGNAVLPDFVLGLPPSPGKQGLGPSGTVCTPQSFIFVGHGG